MSDTYRYGKITDRDRAQYTDILDQAFPDIFRKDNTNHWIDREDPSTFRGMWDGDRLVGSLMNLPCGQWFGGRSVPMGAVRGVAVASESRGSGVATRLMDEMLRETRAQNMPISTLYPATHTFYRKLGYEIAGTQCHYELDLQRISARNRRARLVSFEASDFAMREGIYRLVAGRTNGLIDRSPWFWQRTAASKTMKVRGYVVLGVDGDPEGYFVYEAGEKGLPQEGYRIAIRDWMFLTRDAAERALAFFADYRSVASSIHWWGGPIEPMEVIAGEEAMAIKLHHPWMVRLVDVPRALEARGYRRDLEGRISFTVEDDRFAWNRGPFTLTLKDGRAQVEDGGTPAFTIDIRGLAPLFTSYSSPDDLALLDLLDADAETRVELASIFAGPTPWMVDAF